MSNIDSKRNNLSYQYSQDRSQGGATGACAPPFLKNAFNSFLHQQS